MGGDVGVTPVAQPKWLEEKSSSSCITSPQQNLDLLLEVLPVVSKASKAIKKSLGRQDRSLREFICVFRNELFALNIFESLKSSISSAILDPYVGNVLQCLENVFTDKVLILAGDNVSEDKMQLAISNVTNSCQL